MWMTVQKIWVLTVYALSPGRIVSRNAAGGSSSSSWGSIFTYFPHGPHLIRTCVEYPTSFRPPRHVTSSCSATAVWGKSSELSFSPNRSFPSSSSSYPTFIYRGCDTRAWFFISTMIIYEDLKRKCGKKEKGKPGGEVGFCRTGEMRCVVVRDERVCSGRMDGDMRRTGTRAKGTADLQTHTVEKRHHEIAWGHQKCCIASWWSSQEAISSGIFARFLPLFLGVTSPLGLIELQQNTKSIEQRSFSFRSLSWVQFKRASLFELRFLSTFPLFPSLFVLKNSIIGSAYPCTFQDRKQPGE